MKFLVRQATIKCYLILAFALISINTFASNPVLLDNTHTEVLIGKHLYLLEDPSKALRIKQVSSSDFYPLFKPSEQNTPNAGFSESAYWARFTVKNTTPLRQKWILELAYPPTDLIELYFIDEKGNQTLKKGGDHYPFNEKEFKYPNHAFKFTLEPEQTKTVFVRVESESAVQFPLVIYSSDGLAAKINTQTLIAGVYFGILVVIILYNLILWFSVKKIHHIAYIIYIGFFGLSQFGLLGYAQQYFWPNATWWASHSLIFFFSVCNIFGGLFAKTFLKTSEYVPEIDRWINITIGALTISMVITLFASYATGVKILAALSIISCPLYLVATIKTWQAGYAPARYFVFAGGIVIAFSVLFIVNKFGWIPSNPFTEHSMKFGSAIEVMLLSLALGDRINFERAEKAKAQKIAVESLERSNEIKNTFISTISHELRTPMNGIIGSLELIEAAHNADRPIKPHLSTAESSAHRMSSLVEDILCFANTQSDNFILQREAFCMKNALQNTIHHYQKLCEAKEIHFVHYFDSEYEQSFVGDANKIEKIVIHLLDNAVKFTKSGNVSLYTKTLVDGVPDDQHIAFHIRVVDTGIGIEEDLNQQVYQSFKQADDRFTRAYGGLGIGLAICQTFVKAHEGTISFHSGQNGTSFDVVLFLEKAPPVANSILSPSAKFNQSILNILIVEDDPVNLQILCTLIQKMGHRAFKASNGREAINRVKQYDLDLVFMDCQMPIMDGYESAIQIRRFNPVIPIVAVTANTEEQGKRKCYDAGMNDFVPKPIKKGTIERMISKWRPKPEQKDNSVKLSAQS